jgi:uncharacterized protein YlxW (UPF0749 family)
VDPAPAPAPDAPQPARRVSAWSVGVGVVGLLAGVLLAAGAGAAASSGDLRPERSADLAGLVMQREADVQARAERIDALRADVTGAGAAGATPAATPGPGPDPKATVSAEEAAAGLTAVRGAGLTVLLDDAPRRPGAALPDGVRPDDLVVHQQDVQAVVNALWSAGATGMRIMDQRVVATSAVRCVGNTLILQGRVYAPPFRISAVGDQQRMRDALDDSSAVRAYRDWSEVVGLGYAVDDEPMLELPAYDGPLDLAFAKGAR